MDLYFAQRCFFRNSGFPLSSKPTFPNSNLIWKWDRSSGFNQLNMLKNMSAVKSTPEEWRKGGIRFYKKRLWVAAIHYRYFKMAIFVRHRRQNPPFFCHSARCFSLQRSAFSVIIFLGFVHTIMNGFWAGTKTMPEKAPVHT